MLESILITIGAGTYWSAVMTAHLGGVPTASGIFIQCIVPVVLSIVFCLSAGKFTAARTSWVTLVCLITNLLGFIVLMVGLHGAGEIGTVESICLSVGNCMLMMLWGGRFVSIDRSQAFIEVSRALFFSFVLVALLVWSLTVFHGGAAVHLTIQSILRVVSSVSLAILQKYQSVQVVPREKGPGYRRPSRVRAGQFIVSRCVTGVVLGLSEPMILAFGWSYNGLDTSSGFALAFIAVTCAALLIASWCGWSIKPVAPLLPLAGLVLPISFAGDFSAASCFVHSGVWLAWITVSSIQLSQLKLEFGRSDLFLAFGEKALIMASILVGTIIGQLLFVGRPMAVDPSCAVAPLLVFTLMACLYGSSQLVGLVDLRSREEIMRELSVGDEERLIAVYRNVAADYGLSEREEEIFAHLARGHTAAFISSEMLIAQGTVRAHVAHIYRKTNCHSKEEVFALVERYRGIATAD